MRVAVPFFAIFNSVALREIDVALFDFTVTLQVATTSPPSQEIADITAVPPAATAVT